MEMEQMMECLLAEITAEIRANQAKMDAHLREMRTGEELRKMKCWPRWKPTKKGWKPITKGF
jgi:hypothetical protein